MKTLGILSLVLLSACAGDVTQNRSDSYEYIGCHTVTETPSSTGDVAFGPFGVKTSHIFFKQKFRDGSVAPVTTAVPCD